mmetsp:Transcript_24087/g.60576  ORF Transcript_24087/g.60576 Transcript_24087/m.60576 type:complete len:451 (-) Transcript_24087:141-1493(-)
MCPRVRAGIGKSSFSSSGDMASTATTRAAPRFRDTHIVGQLAHLVLLMVVVGAWESAGEGAQAPSVPEAGEERVTIEIVSPQEMTTVLAIDVVFEVKGLAGSWEDCCFVDILLDREIFGVLQTVHTVNLVEELPVRVDRDRVAFPHGATVHQMVLRLHSFNEPDGLPIAQTPVVLFRLAGERYVFGGDEAHTESFEGQMVRAGFPVAYPTVCAAFLSCGRLALLRRGMTSLVRHMEEHEPDIPYEVAWVDNNSGPDAIAVYLDFGIERVSLNRANYGVTHGMNTLLFDLCRRSRYVITMEEDWEWVAETSSKPAVAMAIEVLQHDRGVIGVVLRSEGSDPYVDLSEWRQTPGKVEYRLRCIAKGSPGYGAWTNGAAVWDRDILERDVGRQAEAWGDDGELEYSKRVGKKYCAAHMRIKADCEGSDCNAVVRHIGEDRNGQLVRSPGWTRV